MRDMTVTIIGIDCATQAKNIGLARGTFINGKAQIVEAIIGAGSVSLADIIADWIYGAQKVLMALDAPLGWPVSLGKELQAHEAGNPIKTEPNKLFRRSTDQFIKSKIGKQPLDVGADRIARTAHAALALLDEIRIRTNEEIPLAWEPDIQTGIYAIEVYPAATLIAHKINAPGYKRREGIEMRKTLLDDLRKLISLPPDLSLMENNDDALDAVICVLAGVDFLSGDAYFPNDKDLAKKESWIWVRNCGE